MILLSNSVIKAPCNLKAQQGDTFYRDYTFTDEDDVALDLSTYSFALKVKNNTGTTVLQWVNADFINTATGVYSITKTPTQMAAVEPGVYSYDLQVTYPSTEVRTWIYGQFIIEQQTT